MKLVKSLAGASGSFFTESIRNTVAISLAGPNWGTCSIPNVGGQGLLGANRDPISDFRISKVFKY